MLRKFLLTFSLVWCAAMMWGQNIRIESFKRVDNDITARTSVVLDANDDECALIKMITTDTDYDVDGYIKRRDDRVGELWFYVPQGTKQIVIRHKRLGKLVYQLPEVLKSKVTYQITLPDNVEIIVHEDAGGQYLVMKVQPAESTVYIDGIVETLNGGVLQKFLGYGTHTYRVEAPMHQATEGKLEIADARKELSISLLPDYGFVKFTSLPENGATVYMNGQELGKTPFTTGRLMKGTYTVNATLPMHAPATQQVVIEPGKTADVTLNFSASYGTVNLTATGSEIYVNNELKGTDEWNGRLSAGLHRIEARKAGHRPGVLSLNVSAGQTQNVMLPAPTAMYASLDISCDKTDAHVYIDGKDMGSAPNVFKILAGKHSIELKNETLKSPKYEVELAEGEAKRIAGVLNTKVIQSVNGYAYVDLGLSVKWADRNVGASSPSAYGSHYAWGETSTKSEYLEGNSRVTYRKKSGNIVGEPQYDVARAKWGATWRLPTKAEWQELLNKCKWIWTTQGGHKGYKIVGPNGNSIFLPSAGSCEGTTFWNKGGFYWSSTSTYRLQFDNSSRSLRSCHRYYGHTVRPVTK